MEYVKTRGAKIPALGFGTWQLEGGECRDAVSGALEIGYRHIDTAQAYDNEAEIGAALDDSGVDRDELWLTTKIWYTDLDYRSVVAGIDRSLEHLRTEYVDLLLIHWPSSTIPLSETMAALAEVRGRGKTRHIGVSNFPPGLMIKALGFESIVCNQVEYHPFLEQNELLQVARAHEIAVIAYCPLARGRVMADRTLRHIGERHGKSPAQVTLRWLLDQGCVAAIPKASRPEHAAANFDIFDFELTPAEQARIAELGGGHEERLINPVWAPIWTH